MNKDILTIFDVWERQSKGYVALPRKKYNTWQEQNFKFPQDKEKILNWIKESVEQGYNLYWCPTVLTKPQRISSNIPKSNILYADLDEISPNSLPNDLQPTVAWQTSKGRYAAIWYINNMYASETTTEINKRLTYFIGADKGGWDLTQVLRIPGLPNFKYSPPEPGRLLWNNNNSYDLSHFKDLPKVENNTNTPYGDIEELDISVNDIIYNNIDKLGNKIIKLLLTPQEELLFADRSETLWELECMLFEAGLSKNEVFTIIKNSVWNKYADRKDQDKRLNIEIEKAYNHSSKGIIPIKRGRKLVTYSELMAQEMEKPKWLIKDWWEAGSHGIVAGEPKTYKSTITTEIAVSVASGKPLFNKYEVITPGPVVIIQEENSEWLMQDRFAKVAGSKNLMGSIVHNDKIIEIKSPDDLPIYMVNREGINLTSEEDKQWIIEICEQLKPVLVIFDPIYLMFGDIDGNSAKELAGTLQWLIQLSTGNNTAVMLVHHFNKGGSSSRGGQRMLGSVTFHAWVQSALYSRIVEGKKNTISIEREFRSFMSPEDIEISFNLGEPGEMSYAVQIGEKDITLVSVIETILMGGSPHSLAELSAQISRSQSELSPILNSLISLGKIIKLPSGKFTLPK